jgi:hypothetical protein
MEGVGSLGAMLQSLAETSSEFVALTHWLHEHPAVESVHRYSWITPAKRIDEHTVAVGSGPGVQVEWYAGAEFRWSTGISFGLTIFWDGVEWEITPVVNSIGSDGEESLVDLPSESAVADADMLRIVKALTAMLWRGRETAVAELIKRSGGE